MPFIHITEVRQRVLSKDPNDTDALNCIATILDLPLPGEIPRPGQVSLWSFEQWKAWSAPFGFTKEDRSKHGLVVTHERLPALVISKASSPGDIRSGLNLGAEVRRTIVAELRFLRSMAAVILETNDEVDTAILVRMLTSPEDRKGWLSAVQKRQEGRVDAKSEQLGKEMAAVLAALGKHGVPAKIALLRAGLESVTDVERMLTVLKSNLTPKVPNLEDVVESLQLQLDNEREAELQEATAKAKARAEAEQKSETKVEEVDKAEIVYNAEVTRGKSRMAAAVKGLHDRIGQLSNAAKGLSEALDGQLFPSFPRDRFRELEAEAKKASAKLNEALANLDAVETSNTFLRERNKELEAMVNELQHEKAEAEKLFNEVAVGPEWKAACVKLVAKLEPLVASNDFLALAQGVAAARVVLADAKKAIDAGVSPTVI
ncbi:MAG: hypothetical protein WC869_00150 [Phycisphaerae bacterium]|jgi:hypothetical protein